MEIPMVVNPTVLWPDPDTGPWRITYYWANCDGWSRLIRVNVQAFEGDGFAPPPGEDAPPITSALLRSLPLLTLADRALAGERAALAGPSPAMADALLGGDAPTMGRPSLPIEGPDGLRRVAEVYRLGGSRPVLAVSEAFCISRSAARKRVQKARRAGLL